MGKISTDDGGKSRIPRSFSPWPMVIVTLLILAFGCKTAPHSSKSKMELTSIFQHLPDSLRTNPFGDKQGLKVTAEEMQRLINDREIALPGETFWRWEYLDSAHTHLQVMRDGPDEGLQYDLLSLPVKGQAPRVLILQSLSDHCCNFTRWALYQVENSRWTDLTATQMPKIAWTDFFDPAIFPADRPAPIRENHFPFHMELRTRPASIAIEPVADYVELEFPPAVSKPMLAQWPETPKVLIWQDGQFVWE
jgi:hypothetical protein